VGLLGIGGWYADTFLGLDKDMNGTLSKQELQGYAEGTLTDIFIERGMFISCLTILKGSCILWLVFVRYLLVLRYSADGDALITVCCAWQFLMSM
jgi:hypothetical protein